MTESLGRAYGSDHTPGGVPQVSPETIAAWRAESHDFDDLFRNIQSVNPKLAEFILTRARELGPRDMRARENTARLALEVFGLMSSQADAKIFEAWLTGHSADEPEPPIAA